MVKNIKESKVFWPIILFPYSINKAHTVAFTGRFWIKDIKASFSFANLILNDTSLICRHRLFNLLIIDLPLKNIMEVDNHDNKPGLITIKFRNAIYGKLTQFALSGQPSGSKEKIIINIKNYNDWINRLNESTRRP